MRIFSLIKSLWHVGKRKLNLHRDDLRSNVPSSNVPSSKALRFEAVRSDNLRSGTQRFDLFRFYTADVYPHSFILVAHLAFARSLCPGLCCKLNSTPQRAVTRNVASKTPSDLNYATGKVGKDREEMGWAFVLIFTSTLYEWPTSNARDRKTKLDSLTYENEWLSKVHGTFIKTVTCFVDLQKAFDRAKSAATF